MEGPQHANAPVPLRKTNMSLFSLFTRPKVQRQRGYAEPGLPPVLAPKSSNVSRLDLTETKPSLDFLPPRSTSALSFRTTNTETSTRRSKMYSSTQHEKYERGPVWDPPPLFQAYPQSFKHGVAEVSVADQGTGLGKSRVARGRLQVPNDPATKGGLDSDKAADNQRIGRGTNGSISRTFQQKIFVLITAGHLLQYAEHGPSGRLPERILSLNGSSAAFASDLVPGEHFVVQISQAVDKQGRPTAPSGSLFSRMGMRSASSRQTVSQMLLVLPSAEEMGDWLRATKNCIASLNGEQPMQDTGAEIKSRDTVSTDTRMRTSVSVQNGSGEMIPYFVRGGEVLEAHLRGRSISPMPPSRQDEPQRDRSPGRRRVSPDSERNPPDSVADAPPSVDAQPHRTDVDEAEAFGAKLALGSSYVRPQTARSRRPSDAGSVASSIAPSQEQLRLNSLRSSVRISTTSHTTGMTSRTNSMTSDLAPHKQSSESTTGYRNLSSYASSLSSKRRSVLPTTTPVPPTLHVQTAETSSLDLRVPSPMLHLTPDVSPTVGRNLSPGPPARAPPQPPQHSITSKQSLPDLPSHTHRTKHDSKLDVSAIAETGRPQSFVGDLPSPYLWSKTHPATKRASLLPSAAEIRTQRISSAPALRNSIIQSRAGGFRLPLKINPIIPEQASTTPAFTPDSQAAQPQIHTLEAKIDPQSRSVSPLEAPPAPPPPDRYPTRPRRVSLFPSPPSHPKAPSTTRPASLMSPTKRSSTQPSIPSASTTETLKPLPTQLRILTPPIRSLKPSRSSTYLPSSHSSTHLPSSRSASPQPPEQPRPASPTDPYRSPISQTFTSPRSSIAGFRPVSALPALDLGISIAGLGPPAPPPLTPLPLPPTFGGGSRPGSRPGSPMGMRRRDASPVVGRGGGLGIRVV
ncbi:hypothetical protein B0A48_16199 [Cryoendolithus antarcticus]|uniref:PH domain-containing protein n=1 Tax=Cryoendolithus antarcticus TaxID=1507870 RepID=A0A1V8SFF2_9PEZI|nr:hypothetical protein B0A48_16199 [Cryoendolithus antarcticus]